MNKYIQRFMAVLVIIFCLVLAYIMHFTNLMDGSMYQVYGTRATILKAMLVGYAIYRSFRLYLTIKKEREDEANSNF